MSSYLTSSERWPLAIGLFLAVFVIVMLSIFMFAVDEVLFGPSAKETTGSLIKQQTREIDNLKESLSNFEKNLSKARELVAIKDELKKIQSANVLRSTQIDALVREEATANHSFVEIYGEFEDYKNQYRAVVRSKAKGEILERLETRGGTVYKDVTISEVSSIGIQIRHQEGSRQIPYEELSDELQDRFQFDSKQKTEAIARENEIRKNHENAVDLSKEVTSKKANLDKQVEASENNKKMHQDLAANELRIKSVKRELESLENSFKTSQNRFNGKPYGRTGNISLSPAMKERQLQNKKEELSQLQQRSINLKQEINANK